jgi:hypothetical protein
MATIIKSDNVANNHLGSILPDLLPKAGLTGFFDFSNGRYVANGNDIGVNDLLTVTRNTPAIGIDKSGNEQVYPVNTPRFHFVQSKKMYGITLGDIIKNHFTNSNAPTTQNITIEEGSENKFFLYVQVIGPGTVTISGGANGTASQGSPLILLVPSKNITITATVTGTPTYVQVSKVTTPYGIDPSRPQTAALPTQKTQDVTQVKRALFDTFYGNSNITVLMKTVRFDGGNLALTPNGNARNILMFDAAVSQAGGGYVGLLEMADGMHAKMYVRKQKAGSVIATSPKVDVEIRDVNVTALILNRTEASVFCNGQFSTLPTEATDVDPYLNFLPGLLTTTSDQIATNSILTKMVVYNRALSSSELFDIYNLMK